MFVKQVRSNNFHNYFSGLFVSWKYCFPFNIFHNYPLSLFHIYPKFLLRDNPFPKYTRKYTVYYMVGVGGGIGGFCDQCLDICADLRKGTDPVLCKPFKEPRNRFPAWGAGTTTLLDAPA